MAITVGTWCLLWLTYESGPRGKW